MILTCYTKNENYNFAGLRPGLKSESGVIMPKELYLLQIMANFLAIFLGPVTAVCITLWAQSRKDKKAAKRQLFLTLMGERKALLISRQVAAALNTIDVVFADNRQIVGLWHKYYTLLSQPPGEEREHTWLELLTAISEDLNYSNLKQTDLDKFYTPQGHANDLEYQREASAEWLRVLKNTQHFLVEKKAEEPTDKVSLSPPK